MGSVPSFRDLSDSDLTQTVANLIGSERAATAAVVASLAEFDRRRLYLALGFSSLYAYCRDAFHLGDGAAYRRIEAARACRRFPIVLELLSNGSVSLTTISLLSPHLTPANHHDLLDEATHQSTREVERIVARLCPRPDVPATVRKLPVCGIEKAAQLEADAAACEAPPTPGHTVPAPASHRPVIATLTPERFRLQITMSKDTHDTLRELQNLMRHAVPSGDPAVIIERALKCLRQEVLRRKCGLRKADIKEPDPQRPESGGHASLLH